MCGKARGRRIRVGKNRRDAERSLRKIAVDVDDGRFQAQPAIAFEDWARQWLTSLERKRSTVRSYESTVAYAIECFGRTPVRRLRPEDVARFSRSLRERGVSDSTRAKHLRVLGACFEGALRHGLTARNPVRVLAPSEKPRPLRKEAAYFENAELPRLFSEFAVGPHRTIFLLALKTGMRQGEILGLTWDDVDLQEAVIRVRRTFTGREVSLPKNHERRDVDLMPDVVELLGSWWGEIGRPTATSDLVFPGESPNGSMSPSNLLRRHLYPAMERAGIPRIGATGEPRVFHSFRHTFAKRALESGAQLTWLSRHLGHSSVVITTRVYGHWERAERRAQMQRLTGAFIV